MQHIPVYYVEVLLNPFPFNSAPTSKNNEEEKSKGWFFSISVYRFLQISGPTNAL